MSPGFRPRWMDCDEPGWNPDSRRDSTAEPEQASDRMALALPSECIVYPIRYTMHVNAEGSERDRKSASLLDGKTESDTPLVLTTMTEESSTFILVSFDDDSYLIIDERSSGVLQIEHASDDAYARIVLGAYEEGATHQLWRFEQPATDRIISCLRETGWLSICATSSWRMEAPLSPTRGTTDGTSSSISTAPAPWIRISPPCRKRLTTRARANFCARTTEVRSPSAFSTSSKPSNPRFPSTR